LTLSIHITPDERVPDLFRVEAEEPSSSMSATIHGDTLESWLNETLTAYRNREVTRVETETGEGE